MSHPNLPDRGRFSSGRDEPSLPHEGVVWRIPPGAARRHSAAAGRPVFSQALTLGTATAAALSLLLVPDVRLLLAQEGYYESLPASEAEQSQAVPLDTLPGLSGPQRTMGAAIDTLCPQLAARAPAGLSAGEQDLLVQCTAIIEASGTDPGAAAAGVVALTPEQAVAPRRVTTQLVGSQVDNLSARLQALRAGAAGRGGLTISGLTLQGQTISGAAAGADGYEFERLAFFVNGNVGWGNKDRSANEDGFDYDIWGVTAGADYVFLDSLVAGIALGYTASSADIDNNGGDLDADTWTLSAYGTWTLDDNLYLEAAAGYGWGSYDQVRNIDYGLLGGLRAATSDYDGSQYNVMLGAGYDLVSGRHIVDLYGRLDYLSTDIDSYTERGARGLDLRIRSQSSSSFTSTLGASYQTAVSTKQAVLVPQLWAEWVHELNDGDQSIGGTFANDPSQVAFILSTDRLDTDYYRVGVGLGAQFPRGVTTFINYEATLGVRDYTEHNINAGVRLAF
jgi:outer membrane autotransporter protein